MYENIVEQYEINQAMEYRKRLEIIRNKQSPGVKNVPFTASHGSGLYSTYRDFLNRDLNALTYNILDDMYRNTKFYAVVDIIVGDILSGDYTVQCDDDKANKFCRDLTKKWTYESRELSLKEFFVQGNSYDFIQWALDDKTVLDIQEMDGQYIMPHLSHQDNSIEKYTYVNTTNEFGTGEILKLSYNRRKAQHFGMSLLTPAAATLELLLNSSTNIAVLMDRFAAPIVHWLLDSGLQDPDGNYVKVTAEDIAEFLSTLMATKAGEDIVTDKGVKGEIIGNNNSVWNFDGAINFLNSEFYAICGVPATLLGYGGSNKEISTRQLKVYLNRILKHQKSIGSQLIENFYQPSLMAKDFDVDCQIIWPKKEIEERSERWSWVSGMWDRGGITTGEMREAMEYSFDLPKETQTVVVPAAAVSRQIGAMYANQNAGGNDLTSGGENQITGKNKKENDVSDPNGDKNKKV